MERGPTSSVSVELSTGPGTKCVLSTDWLGEGSHFWVAPRAALKVFL